MKFETMTFAFATNPIPLKQRKFANEGEVVTEVTLTESDVSDEIVRDSAVSGQSPRVRIQSAWRADGVPKTVKMSWADWFGKPTRVSRVVNLTPEQIRAEALKGAANDADARAKMIAELLAMDKE